MLASQPAVSPAGITLLAVTIYLVVRSPAKWATLLRAVAAAAVTMAAIAVLVLVGGLPQVWLRTGGLLAELAAAVAAWWHWRRLRQPAAPPLGEPGGS